jgi:transposase
LIALTRHVLREDPVSGQLFVFFNRRSTLVKVLYWDRSGFCVWAKRLEAGRFIPDWSKASTRETDWTGLKLLLEGIEPGRIRKRYRLPETPDMAEKITLKHGLETSCRGIIPA